MTPFKIIENQLRQNMIEGERHGCRRDCARTAGGYLAGGALTQAEVADLGAIAASLSSTPVKSDKDWNKAVEYGMNHPLTWDDNYKHVTTEDKAFGWDQPIPGALKVVEKEWLQDEEIRQPSEKKWNPVNEITTYLSELFKPDEYVGYVTESWTPEGSDKHVPQKGHFDRTSGELIKKVSKSQDLGLVFGDTDDSVGAWIRFNPLDGKGVKDENVTDYRYALIESDCMPIPKQVALLKKLELPIKVIVHSGGKSAHAIVKIEADSYAQYQERVDFLYKACKENGLELDKQNRNPSRLSRMPGVIRNDNKQFIIDRNIGHNSWDEWKEWIDGINDDLPDIEDDNINEDEEPKLKGELIKGVLREGHKLLISGPSKAGKSFSLIQLAIAIANGGQWLGYECMKGKCMYVNLELDKDSCNHRIWKISKIVGFNKDNSLHRWNLRGSATTMDLLAPKLIKRAKKIGYKAIIIDPIYKVLTGDENSASEMAHFTNQFDKIAVKIGAAVICCHHHSKGSQGQKSSKDRSSGSGVFARDPDAILDLIELEITDERRKALVNIWECEAMHSAIAKSDPHWRYCCPEDDAIVADKLMEWALDNNYNAVNEAREVGREAAINASGWRVEMTLREFPPTKPIRCFFRYPVHVMDHSDMLKDAKAEGEEPAWKSEKKNKQKSSEDRKKERMDGIEETFSALDMGEPVSLKEMAEYRGVDPKTVQKHIKEHPGFDSKEGIVFRKKQG